MPHIRLGVVCAACTVLLLAPPPGAAAQTGPEPAEGGPPATEAAAATADAASDAGPTEPSVDQLHDELRAVRATMETALNEKDLDALTAHVTPDVVFTTMNGDVVHGPDGIRDYYRKMMEGEDRVVDSISAHFVPDDLSILLDPDAAVAFGSTEDRYELAGGRTFEVAARWTATLVRRDGAWKIAAFHYSTNMFDNPVLDAQRSALVKAAIGAALVAFVLALLVGRALGRRSAAG